MRQITNLNHNWLFHLGEIKQPLQMAKKSYAFGGLTAPLKNEDGEITPLSAGGHHFLKLIAQGDEIKGLHQLAGTVINAELRDDWATVNVPDDWKRREDYQNDPANLMSGSKPDGVAYYRKTFLLADDEVENSTYLLHFDGIMRSADVWMNGAYLGHNNSGYTSFDLDVSPFIRPRKDGVNVILVRTDTTTGAEGWWYEGAGIYKPVWLEKLAKVHVEKDSFYVRTLKVTSTSADMTAEFAVINDDDEPVSVAPQFTAASTVAHQFNETESLPGTSHTFSWKFTIDNPQLWTPETPYLSTAKVKLADDETAIEYGIHTFAYDQTGFILNGHHYELHGVCEHQDFGGVGVALTQDIVDYKITTFKKMGVNALRSSHHFASKELLSACDHLGMILIDENRLLEATPWRLADLKKMIRKARSHASVAFWSIANEEVVGNTEFAKRSVKTIANLIKRLDPDKLLISAELLNPEGKVNEDYLQCFDILGVNYPEAGVMGNGAELIHHSRPQLPMMSTENASYFSTRGIYKDDGDKCYTNNLGSMYSMVLPGKRQPGDPGVGGTAHPEEVMDYLNSHSYMGGVFLWTGFDYYGEPSPFGWPGISSQFGICDLGGLPKDYYYYYQAHWINQPVLHLLPSWNKDELEIDDGYTQVRVFSNLDEVELFVNGKSQGKQAVSNFENNWQVKYEPGELTVKGYRAGKMIAEDHRVSSGQVVAVEAKALYTGSESTIYELVAKDDAGRFASNADCLVKIQSSGQIIAVTNGDPSDQNSYYDGEIKLFRGKAVVVAAKGEQLTVTLAE